MSLKPPTCEPQSRILFTFDPANLFPGRSQSLENLRPKHYEFEAQKLKERDPQGKTKFKHFKGCKPLQKNESETSQNQP